MLELRNISKKYKDFNLNNVCITIEDGKYFVLLGKSGSGKSLLLQIIAGLIHPDKGEVIVNGKYITNTKIQNRHIGLVFQDYAIFPHLSIYDNIAFPLKFKRLNKKQISQKVNKLAEKTGVVALLHRKPNTLSGGELQRVALARTLASEPKYLLLDEPLSSLDIQLRSELQSLLRNINKDGITIIHVTHNFEEAISLADKVGIINNGSIIQVGSPKEIFHNPKSKFVANFTGIKNFYNAIIISKNAVLLENKIKVVYISQRENGAGMIMFRSEDIVV
ncbi:MAG: ABC transporter, partial [Bacteroidetes bacterium]